MIKQLVRGYIYFEDKKKEDVEKIFNPFKFDEAKFKLFEKIKINNKEILHPGVFLNGQINEKYTSENVVRLFRKLIGLDITKKNCDLSVEKEDEIDAMDAEREFNFYYEINFKKIEKDELVANFKNKLSNENIFRTRDIGYNEGELMVALEVFSKTNIDEKIDNLLFDEKIDINKVTIIQF